MAPRRRFLAAVVAGWLAWLALDFLLHAVLLSPWWRATDAYWLRPRELFARIPYAYAAFALYAAALVWLLERVRGERPAPARGAALGAAVGLIAGAITALGNYSVLPLPASALAVWPGTMAIESAAAGFAAAAVLRAPRPWRRALLVLALALALFAVAVILQNLLVPTPAGRVLGRIVPRLAALPLGATLGIRSGRGSRSIARPARRRLPGPQRRSEARPMSSRAVIEDFLSQKTLAVVGVSRRGAKFGNAALRELRARGYRVLPVHPEAESLEGERCYASLAALPEPVGGVLIAVPPRRTEQVVREAAQAGIRRVWMQQGADSAEAVRFCKENGIDEVHGECVLMFTEPARFPHRQHRWVWKMLGKLPK